MGSNVEIAQIRATLKLPLASVRLEPRLLRAPVFEAALSAPPFSRIALIAIPPLFPRPVRHEAHSEAGSS